MTTEELQARYDQFAIYVKRYRSYQTSYEMYKKEKDKNNMLRYQRMVDKMLADEAKVEDSKQLKIVL